MSDTNIPLGPDAVELHAHSPNFMIDQLQSRRSSGVNVPFRVVPMGLSPQQHFHAAMNEQSPFLGEPKLPEDLDFAVRTVVREGKDIGKWRRVQMDKLWEVSRYCKNLEHDAAQSRGVNSQNCASAINVHNIAIAAAAINWPDAAFVRDLCVGANPLGMQPEFGIFRHREVGATETIESMLAANRSYVNSLDAR